jgi:hypothetical protein
LENSLVAERLAASEEGLSAMKLVLKEISCTVSVLSVIFYKGNLGTTIRVTGREGP